MTINLDNGTTIEITEDMISITNGFRGFTWDLNTNELHRATDTVMVEEPQNDMRALATKLTQWVGVHLGYINGCVNHNESGYCEIFKGLLRDEDLTPPEINLYKNI